jgi:branched-chain amino acid transport system substrate-binding protein
MVHSVILRIFDGSFEQGFKIDAEIRQDRKIIDTERGQLTPQADIPRLYREAFDTHYPTWGTRSELGSRVIEDGDGIEVIKACIDTSAELEKSFQTWLKQADLGDIQTKIAQTIPKGSQPIFILETPDNSILQQLPWHRWNWLTRNFPNTEIVLSRKAFQVVPLLKRLRILVVLGSEKGIDLKPDWDALQRNLDPVAELVQLKQPSLNRLRTELCQGCNAVFFAGHSNTNSTGDDGWIKIDNGSPITIDHILDELREAIRKGLNLVFLNSCNSLGIASRLSDLNVPYIIAMRQEIHNDVAVKFIEHCLKYLARGESLTRSVSEARKELRNLEGKYICASWMPVIYQSREAPDYIPFPQNIWRDFYYQLVHKSFLSFQLPSRLFGNRSMKTPPIVFLAIGLIVPVVMHQYWQSPTNDDLAQSIGDRLLFEQISSLDKKSGIQAFKDKQYDLAIVHFNRSLQSQPNDPETRIYTNNAQVLKETKKDPESLPVIPVISSASNGYSTAVDVLRGAAIAQMDINDNGGIKGQKMLLNIVLDHNNQQEAEKVARKLVEDQKVRVVIGHIDSDTSVVAAPIYQQAGLTMISPTSSSMELKGQGKYIFRTAPNSEMMAQTLAKYVSLGAKKKKLGFCSSSTLSAGKTFERAFIGAFAQHDGQILPTSCDISASGFSPDVAVQKIKQAGADGLLIYFQINHPQHFETAKNLARVAKAHQLSLFGPHALIAPEIQGSGSIFEGMVVVTPRHPDSPLAKDFSERSRVIFGQEATWRGLSSFDAVKAGAEGWNRSNISRDSIQQQLHDPKFSIPGSSGPIKFSQSGDRLVTSSIAQLQKSGDKYKFILLPPLPTNTNK